VKFSGALIDEQGATTQVKVDHNIRDWNEFQA